MKFSIVQDDDFNKCIVLHHNLLLLFISGEKSKSSKSDKKDENLGLGTMLADLEAIENLRKAQLDRNKEQLASSSLQKGGDGLKSLLSQQSSSKFFLESLSKDLNARQHKKAGTPEPNPDDTDTSSSSSSDDTDTGTDTDTDTDTDDQAQQPQQHKASNGLPAGYKIPRLNLKPPNSQV